jgi:peptidylprolyl isomerase
VRARTLGARLLVAAGLLAGAAPDPVVAMRGSDKLTASDVRALIASQPQEQRAKLQSDPDGLRRLVTDALVQRALINEANTEKWANRPEVAALLARVRDGAILQSFLSAHSQLPPGYPSDVEVQAAYDRAGPQLARPRGYHLAQVFVAVAPHAPAADTEKARRTLTTFAQDILLGHAKFETPGAQAADAKYADLGWVGEPQLQTNARDAVAGLLEGQVSAPVCSAGGCTLIKLISTRAAGPPPLAEVHDQLVRLLREQKQKQLAQAYVNTMLAKAPVRLDQAALGHLSGH